MIQRLIQPSAQAFLELLLFAQHIPVPSICHKVSSQIQWRLMLLWSSVNVLCVPFDFRYYISLRTPHVVAKLTKAWIVFHMHTEMTTCQLYLGNGASQSCSAITFGSCVALVSPDLLSPPRHEARQKFETKIFHKPLCRRVCNNIFSPQCSATPSIV